MAKSETIHCGTHGKRRLTFVCRHLVRGTGLGFHQAQALPDENSPEQCDWCSDCEKVRIRYGGEWTDESEEFAGVTVI